MEKNRFLEVIRHETDMQPYSVHRTRCAAGETREPVLYIHWHPELEFFMMEQGCVELMVEDEHITVRKGEAVLIPPGMLHWGNASEDCVYRALVVQPQWIASAEEASYGEFIAPLYTMPKKMIIHMDYSEEWMKRVLKALLCILDVNVNVGRSRELCIRGNLMLMWQDIYDNVISRYSEDTRNRSLRERLQPAIKYMEENFSGDVRLSELADISHLSEGQFCRSFREWAGCTAFHYLNRLRILQSCRMLSEGRQKISEIACACGFNSISYYNRTFILFMGVKPSEYRKRQRPAG